MQAYRNLISGKWVPAASGKAFPSLNPATEAVIARFAASDRRDIEAAVAAAEKALPSWSATLAPKRGAILLKVAQLLRESKERLARLETIEMGKVLAEARADVQEAIDIAEFMAGEGRRLYGTTTPSELKDKFAMTVRRPIGVCGLITPWNFPIAIPAWKAMPALVAGNTLVLKPSSDTPLCAVEFVKVLAAAGVPPGVINLVTGGGSEAGMPLVTSKAVRCVSFTGSRETGNIIAKAAGAKRVGLELGGKNPIIVNKDADLALALEGVLWGAFGTTGQRCTAASRVIVHRKIAAQFTRKLLAAAKTLRMGNGLLPRTDLGPLVNASGRHKVSHYVELGKEEGAKLLCGGAAPRGKGYFFPPTIFKATMDMRLCREEIFGPVLSVIEAKDLDHAIDLANAVDYGLSSALYTRDVRAAFRAIQQLETGITYINASTIGAEVHLPFGGVKGSGTAREGSAGIEEFTEVKTVYIDYSGKLQKAQMEEP